MIWTLLGGVGIFLVGMILLSDGLKGAAGGALRSILQRFARSPGRAVISGAGVTALVQSSSATTLTTIGFVSAGLLTFPQAVGVIFGANLGTTSTGWLVAILGFKVNLGAVALPVVGAGALLRLLGRGRWSQGGMALAGFGLIFVGIDVLQDGMAGVAERIDPTLLPGATLGGRVVLVLAGTVLTVVMQSSSAAVATTLTALHAGGITLEQAAYLVIGQNLGTSVKAVLAAIGGSVPVRRTAVAHTLFNLLTGVLALVLFPLLLAGARWLAGPGDPATAIAIFHTGFNLLGVAIFFPVLGRFAAGVQRLVPEVQPSLVRNLDRTVAEVPEVAVEAARQSALGVERVLLGGLARLMAQAGGERLERGGREGRGGPGRMGPGTPTLAPGAEDRPLHLPSREDPRIAEVGDAIAAIRRFLTRVRSHPDGHGPFPRHLSLVHAVDHLDRLEELRREFGELGEVPPELAPRLRSLARELLHSADGERERLEGVSRELAEARRQGRARILEEVAAGETAPDAGRMAILHLKRMDRVAYHAWRAAHHLAMAAGEGGNGEDDPVALHPLDPPEEVSGGLE